MLVGVGRNLNRAIRTCYSFGVYDVYCVNCTGQISGNLFAAKAVRLHQGMPRAESILALEVAKSLPPLGSIPAESIKYLVVGGESVTLRRKDFPLMARIPTANKLCLTTEASLAIALYHFGGDR